MMFARIRTTVTTATIIVDSAFRLREKADYEDFYVVSAEDAERQIGKAENVIAVVERYAETRWDKD